MLQLFWSDAPAKDNGLTIAFRIMVHLAQQTQHIINDIEDCDLIFIQNMFDKIHQVFIQFIDTLYFLSDDR